MKYLLYLAGMASGVPTPFDDSYLVEYDPTRPGVDANGEETICHLVTTKDPKKALALEFVDLWRLWRTGYGKRPHDKMPNRPLTAFSVSFVDAESLERVM